MPRRDVIVIGASAGGVGALQQLFRALPGGLPAAIFVVLHRSPTGRSMLEQVLHDGLPVDQAEDRAPIRRGRIVVAPPARHLSLRSRYMRVEFGPRENGHRPSVDTLFRSAAETFGPRVIGVVLTGSLSDGAAGLAAIKERGGVAIVQDPAEAFDPGMPLSALRATEVDHKLPLKEIATCLVGLSGAKMPARAPHPTPIPSAQNPALEAFVCPECGGALREVNANADPPVFRCFVGHGYTLPTLVDDQAKATEEALWRAARTLRERATLLRRLAQRTGAGQFISRAELAERDAGMIEAMLPEETT